MRFSQRQSGASILKGASSACLIAAALFISTTSAQQTSEAAQERSRLIGLHREAVASLQDVARAGASADQARRALLDASRNFEALGAGSNLDPTLRSELRRGAADLKTLA